MLYVTSPAKDVAMVGWDPKLLCNSKMHFIMPSLKANTSVHSLNTY